MLRMPVLTAQRLTQKDNKAVFDHIALGGCCDYSHLCHNGLGCNIKEHITLDIDLRTKE